MLSTTTEYALRALVELARASRGGSVLGKELSTASRVPANYLAKILVDLKRAGLVTASRGTGGGYRLRRSPQDIRLIEVIRVFEPDRAEPRCLLSGDRACSDDDPCSAHRKWCSVRTAFVGFLEATTVAELADHESS